VYCVIRYGHEEKYPCSFRLTERAQQLIERLSAHLGIPKTGVVEVAIRELARRIMGFCLDRKARTLIVDPEFKSLIPPIREEEFAQLERNLISEGIRDPLVTWRGILLDGHNRLLVAEKHGLDYDTIEIDLPDRDAARLWIVRNQLGRRNLTPQQASYLRGKWYENEKKGVGRPQKSYQNDRIIGETSKRIAQQTGTHWQTVIRDAEFARSVDRIAEVVGPEARQAILSGQVHIPKKDVKEIAEIAPEAPELVAELVAGERSLTQVKRELHRNQQVEAPPIPGGKYRCIVIDPPWPMDKIERKVRPQQGPVLDYPTMTLDEIAELPIPDLADENGCHVYLWVTHKYLPAGLELFSKWGVRYQCVMTWVKNVGITPYSWMYSTEHVLFGRVGSLKLNQLGLRLDFPAPRTRHSEKPDIFYERVVQASPEPRLEMFARKERAGFIVWGNEV